MDDLAIVFSRALVGFTTHLVEVETHLSNGLPQFQIVGLPETTVKESRERVRAAIIQSGYTFPTKKIIINLAPADLPKDSGRFDLPIAISLLKASGQIEGDIENYEFAAELALSGLLRPIKGALLIAQAANNQHRTAILPFENQAIASLIPNIPCLFAKTLTDIILHLNKIKDLTKFNQQPIPEYIPEHQQSNLNLHDIIGQHTAKKALEISAAGGHSILMIGPPGTGKSMLAERLPSLLPNLTKSEILENAAIHSLITTNIDYAVITTRPFRSPHHSASAVAIIGGGSIPKPGEITLANNGILFLDELPEFDRKVLEVLREPLESKNINISRAANQVDFPAKFQLVAAMNPCPCGFYGHPQKACQCTPEQIKRYTQKISGPLLDRIDIIIEVPPLSLSEMKNQTKNNETSDQVKKRVANSRHIQLKRQDKLNSELLGRDLEKHSNITSDALNFLLNNSEKLQLSTRSFHKILRIARTIADIENSLSVKNQHILQAISLRRVQILF